MRQYDAIQNEQAIIIVKVSSIEFVPKRTCKSEKKLDGQ